MSKHHQIALLALYISLPLVTGSGPSSIFSGFQPDCQTCLNDAVQLCNSTNTFDSFCICDVSGAGYDEAFSSCPIICGLDDRNRGHVLLSQWADYCCLRMPEASSCADYLKNPESVIPSVLPTISTASSASTSAFTTGTSATSTREPTPTSSKSLAHRNLQDPATVLCSAIGLIYLFRWRQ